MDFIYKVLQSDIELLAAALSEIEVRIAVKAADEELAGLGGPIRAYTPNAVRIRGLSYSRELYEFRVRLRCE
ncbi:hypothetical protein [Paenibacillus sp. MMS20-IR301]|uniref:hypothetical protein n=1 Tax=Paenibacillus sp. MMS20-IR301 TaxID=2895946 RepID=UPI0028EB3579|nr:hypothetical protein [Paenibacillus sp. MMS20-IR301]WNS45842.1 hypothetical protein LOS79_11405 [Paenibacillus sp. MMS20-IR301]